MRPVRLWRRALGAQSLQHARGGGGGVRCRAAKREYASEAGEKQRPWAQPEADNGGPAPTPLAPQGEEKAAAREEGLYLDDVECAKAISAEWPRKVNTSAPYARTEMLSAAIRKKVARLRRAGSHPAAVTCVECMRLVGDASVHCAKDILHDYVHAAPSLSGEPFRAFLRICSDHRAHVSAVETLRLMHEKGVPVFASDYEMAFDACKYSDDAVKSVLRVMKENGHAKWLSSSWLLVAVLRACATYSFASAVAVRKKELVGPKSLIALMGVAKRSREPGNAEEVDRFARSLGHVVRNPLYYNLWLTTCKDANELDRAVALFTEDVQNPDAYTYSIMINIFVARSAKMFDHDFEQASQMFDRADRENYLSIPCCTALMSLYAKHAPKADTEALALKKKFEQRFRQRMPGPLNTEFEVAMSLGKRPSRRLEPMHHDR